MVILVIQKIHYTNNTSLFKKSWEDPKKQFPKYSEKIQVPAIQEKLSLTNVDFIYKNQLICFANLYLENENTVDTTMFGVIYNYDVCIFNKIAIFTVYT